VLTPLMAQVLTPLNGAEADPPIKMI